MASPSTWPLEGTVLQAYKHYYENSDTMEYPPPGSIQEVSYYGKLSMESVGHIERDNLDVFFLAFLCKLKAVEGDENGLRQIKAMAAIVPTRFHHRLTIDQKLVAVYQHKENEEKNAEVLGHSLLSRARELVGLQEPRERDSLI